LMLLITVQRWLDKAYPGIKPLPIPREPFIKERVYRALESFFDADSYDRLDLFELYPGVIEPLYWLMLNQEVGVGYTGIGVLEIASEQDSTGLLLAVSPTADQAKLLIEIQLMQ